MFGEHIEIVLKGAIYFVIFRVRKRFIPILHQCSYILIFTAFQPLSYLLKDKKQIFDPKLSEIIKMKTQLLRWVEQLQL